MSKVIIPRSELPIPVSDHINKFRYRIVNDNRNIFSDWSVISYAYQDELDRNSTRGIPSTIGAPEGAIPVVIGIDPVDNWDIGWVPVPTWIEDNSIITVDTNHDMPSGGTTGQVLTKLSNEDYVAYWEDSSIPNGGTTGQALMKYSNADGDTYWGNVPDPGTNNPQIANLSIGLSMFA